MSCLDGDAACESKLVLTKCMAGFVTICVVVRLVRSIDCEADGSEGRAAGAVRSGSMGRRNDVLGCL